MSVLRYYKTITMSVDWKKWQEASRYHFGHVAPKYDGGRTFEKGQFWAKEIQHYVNLSTADRLLDVGCGTGLFAIPFARVLPCQVVGIDLSPMMLAQADIKLQTRKVYWTQSEAMTVPFADDSFQALFLSQVWHHLADGSQAAKEFCRLLKPGGCLFVKTFSHDQLRARWDITQVFPSLLEFMLAIYPDISTFESLFAETGFTKVYYTTYCQPATILPSAMLTIAEQKLWSMFSYLDEKNRQNGMRYLRQCLVDTNDAPVKYDEMHLLMIAQK